MDRDEDFIPKVFPPATLPEPEYAEQLSHILPDHFASLPEDLGSACFGKSYHSGLVDVSDLVSPEVASTRPLELARVDSLPDPTASVKCMHRVTGVEYGSVQCVISCLHSLRPLMTRTSAH